MNEQTQRDMGTGVEVTEPRFQEDLEAEFLPLPERLRSIVYLPGAQELSTPPPRPWVFLLALQGKRVLPGPWLEGLLPPLNHYAFT